MCAGEEMPWMVNKFGGTSVASAEAMRMVKDIVMGQVETRGDAGKMAVVVSAMGGKPKVTDLLLNSVALAAAGNREGSEAVLTSIRAKHSQAIELLGLPAEDSERIQAVVESDLSDIRVLLKAVHLMRHEDGKMRELVSGFGEVWSSQILCALLNKNSEGRRFCFLNARRVLIVADPPEGEAMSTSPGPEIDWDESLSRLGEFLSSEEAKSCPTGIVITGFVASTKAGVATTLQRDGSDYSASIFGKLLQASAVQIWTDVDGVLSADPRKVPEAKVLPEVSFNEAVELAYFGAKVIHPKTMQPAVTAGIPILIKNTFNPAFPGTRIFTSSTATKDRRRCICGFSTMDNIALLNLEGMGMAGHPGVAARLFGALQRVGISVILISQASSEHSISVAIEVAGAAAAKKVTEEAFAVEIRSETVAVDVISPCCIVAAIGDGMSHTTGVSGRFFEALGSASINVLAIAQGCSERNISCVVEQRQSAKALRAVHAAFLLSHLTVSVGVVGTGTIGASLLGMLVEQREVLRTQFHLDLQIRAMLLSGTPINLARWNDSLNAPPGVEEEREGMRGLGANPCDYDDGANGRGDTGCAQPLDVPAFVDFVKSDHLPHSVIVDCSTADGATSDHASWLSLGLHVVSSNKLASGGALGSYHELLKARDTSPASYHYETTVGGALPVVTTLQNLRSAGDEVLRIEGVLSAFLSYIFNRISPGPDCSGGGGGGGGKQHKEPVAFSKACWEAAEQGLMDLGDVVKDLGCEDQRRVLLILGREMGLELEESDVKLEPVLDVSNEVGGSETVARVSALDAEMKRRVEAARGAGKVLRYVIKVECNGANGREEATAGIREVEMSHPYAGLKGAAFCVMYQTKRMGESAPMVLQGPMGGPETVASGLLADLLRVCTSLGARDRGHGHLMKSASSAGLAGASRS
ncbi:unnamed protein product [Ectocarpus sp. CCAP 1310/34]|nr:unnamed protein product [Ectocarpus sp. CCAP 1310/34]